MPVQVAPLKAIVQPGRYAIATSETVTAGEADSLTLPMVAVVRLLRAANAGLL